VIIVIAHVSNVDFEEKNVTVNLSLRPIFKTPCCFSLIYAIYLLLISYLL